MFVLCLSCCVYCSFVLSALLAYFYLSPSLFIDCVVVVLSLYLIGDIFCVAILLYFLFIVVLFVCWFVSCVFLQVVWVLF